MTEHKTTHTPNNKTTHTNQRRRQHSPSLGTSIRTLSPRLCLLSSMMSLAVSSSLSSPLSSSAWGGGRSCLILVSVLLACSLVSLSFTCLNVSVARLRTITPLRPHNLQKEKGGGVDVRGRAGWRGGQGGKGGIWMRESERKEEGGKTNFFRVEKLLCFFFPDTF